MSESSQRRSEEFLKISGQFKLGALSTESSHPVTANLSDAARQNTSEGLKLLFEVDGDVIRKYREVVNSGRAEQIAATVLAALRNGGRIFFTGCGSTGRLSIQLVSIWRDFWQRKKPAGDGLVTGSPVVWENRASAVMAGGDYALIKAVEGFEDFTQFGRKQIKDLGVSNKDVVFAITEGGETSFVIGTAWEGVDAGAKVYFIYNNPDEVLCQHVERSREVIQESRIEKVNLTTGAMGITGSTRMQATSIQLAVLVTIMEMVVCDLAKEAGADEIQVSRQRADIPADFAVALGEIHATIKSPQVLAQLANVVELEETVYRAGGKNNYFADRLGIDLLTDTTERSPTYCTPPFRKWDDISAAESWAFLYVPYPDSAGAWERICRRRPNCIEWRADEVRDLVPADKHTRTMEIISKISYAELMRFRIGTDGLEQRRLAGKDSAVVVLGEAEKDSLLSSEGFFRTQLEEARKAGARTGLVFLGSAESCREVDQFVKSWQPDCVAVLVPVTRTHFILNGDLRVGLKMLLNALSTCTMVRLGRVMGNFMIWVVPSNLKLIDRATRYVQKLTGLEYAKANELLFEVIEYVEPRMKADQAYPPVVGMSVLRQRFGLSNEEAERRLNQEIEDTPR